MNPRNRLPVAAAAAILLALTPPPARGLFESDGKILMAVGRHGVCVLDPWRRTVLRSWTERETQQSPGFSPDARWMAETDGPGRTLRVVDLERRERDRVVLDGSDYSPVGAIFGEDASKLWVLAQSTKSILEMVAPHWRTGRNLPLQGPNPTRGWRCGRRGFIFQPPSVLTEMDLQEGKILGAVPLGEAQDVVCDALGEHILALGSKEWRLFRYGHQGATWKAPARPEPASRVCLLGVAPPAQDSGPQVVVVGAEGADLAGYQAGTEAGGSAPPPSPDATPSPPLDAYVPADIPKVDAPPAEARAAEAPAARLVAVWRTPLPGHFGCPLASPDGGTLFLGQEEPPELLVLNAHSHQAIARIPLPFAPTQLVWP